MKLHAPKAMRRIDHRARGRIGGFADDAHALGHRLDAIGVRHPHGDLLAGGEARKEVRGVCYGNVGPSVLALLRRFDAAAQHLGGELHAIADAELGNIE